MEQCILLAVQPSGEKYSPQRTERLGGEKWGIKLAVTEMLLLTFPIEHSSPRAREELAVLWVQPSFHELGATPAAPQLPWWEAGLLQQVLKALIFVCVSLWCFPKLVERRVFALQDLLTNLGTHEITVQLHKEAEGCKRLCERSSLGKINTLLKLMRFLCCC